jgi:ectoine hydroxylase-related dioxygenase (phytanoyl-CoA dioxygenase family)
MTGRPRTLAAVHGYLLDVLPRARTRAEAERFRLTPGQVERFERDGFLTGVQVLEPEQVAEVGERLEQLRHELRAHAATLYEVEQAWLDRPGEVVLHFLGGWLIDPWLHDLVFAPQVTVPLAQLLGVARLRFFHDQVFYKPARHRGVVPWHQDYSYWTRTAPACHITMNIVLDPSTRASGCVEFVPGSHRWGLLPKVPFDADRAAVLAHLTDAQRAAFRPVAAELAPGQASIHHSHTLHGSGANASERPRRALVLNYMGPETRCADAQPLLRGVPPIPLGARIEGDHFPIAFDADALA